MLAARRPATTSGRSAGVRPAGLLDQEGAPLAVHAGVYHLAHEHDVVAAVVVRDPDAALHPGERVVEDRRAERRLAEADVLAELVLSAALRLDEQLQQVELAVLDDVHGEVPV